MRGAVGPHASAARQTAQIHGTAINAQSFITDRNCILSLLLSVRYLTLRVSSTLCRSRELNLKTSATSVRFMTPPACSAHATTVEAPTMHGRAKYTTSRTTEESLLTASEPAMSNTMRDTSRRFIAAWSLRHARPSGNRRYGSDDERTHPDEHDQPHSWESGLNFRFGQLVFSENLLVPHPSES